MRMLPESGRTRPTMLRMSVDLPAPFGPRRPKQEPGRISRETPATAVTAPKRFRTSLTDRGGEEVDTSDMRNPNAATLLTMIRTFIRMGYDILQGEQVLQLRQVSFPNRVPRSSN